MHSTCDSDCLGNRQPVAMSEKIKFFDDIGNVHYIDLYAPIDSLLDLYFTQNHYFGSCRFWLYTRHNTNKYEELYTHTVPNSSAKENSTYRSDRPLVMVTHGWMSNGDSNATQLIKDAYLYMKNVNVVVVSWDKDAAHENYLSSASLTMLVAEKVKDMVLSLAFEYKLDGKDVHLIGHSLGAHVMGLAGEKLRQDKFIVARVTGLDPARPFFELPMYLPGITSESACFVDIIQTAEGWVIEGDSYYMVKRNDVEVSEKIKFMDERGKLHYIDLGTPIDSLWDLHFAQSRYAGSTRFWLYTRDNINKYEEIYTRFTKKARVKASSMYRPNGQLVVITHGWMSSGHSNATQLIKDAYLGKQDANVLVVDWNKDAAYENYISSASSTMLVAEKVRDMVLSLAFQYQLKGKDVHLIGHSLGAHVMGLAGQKLKHDNFIVARVTGLDPARPFFELPNYLPGITSEAASFVDIIHTDSGLLGYIDNIGHADFYPNGGNWQPHCCDIHFTISCEHTCAYVYFSESIKRDSKYISLKCDSYIDFEFGLCNGNEEQVMGQSSPTTARGNFYLDID